jgi:hypothetical protein
MSCAAEPGVGSALRGEQQCRNASRELHDVDGEMLRGMKARVCMRLEYIARYVIEANATMLQRRTKSECKFTPNTSTIGIPFLFTFLPFPI